MKYLVAMQLFLDSGKISKASLYRWMALYKAGKEIAVKQLEQPALDAFIALLNEQKTATKELAEKVDKISDKMDKQHTENLDGQEVGKKELMEQIGALLAALKPGSSSKDKL